MNTTLEEELNNSYRYLRKTAQNSTSIILPHFMIDELGWEHQDIIKVSKEGKKIILERFRLGPNHEPSTNENERQ